MVTRKEFKRAAIRVLCEMVVADGNIVKEELVELAQIADEYRLWKSDSIHKKRTGQQVKTNENMWLEGNFDSKKIQDAYSITLSQAIRDIKEWGKTNKDDVYTLQEQLAKISTVDGECSPNEARIRLALHYALTKDAIAFSVKKNYRFSKREIIYIENDIEDERIIDYLIDGHWMDSDSYLWQGFQLYEKEHQGNIDPEELYKIYLKEYYLKINKEIQNNFEHYQRELKLMGFNLVYLPHTIKKMSSFGAGGELLLPSIQIANPAKLYGKKFDEVLKVMCETKTYDFANILLHEIQELIPDLTPSLLFKISDSNVVTLSSDDGEKETIDSHVDSNVDIKTSYGEKEVIDRYTDFLVIKIRDGIVGKVIDDLLSTYLSLTNHYYQMVEEHYASHFNTLSFDRTLLDIAANRVYGKEVVKEIVLDLTQSRVHFRYEGNKGNDLETIMPLTAQAFALYLLILRAPVKQLPLKDIDFEMPSKCSCEDAESFKARQSAIRENRQKYSEYFRQYEACRIIYKKISGSRRYEMNLYDYTSKVIGIIKDAIKGLTTLPNRDAYWPKLKDGKYDICRDKFDASIVYVKEDLNGSLLKLSDWWNEKIAPQLPSKLPF